MCKTKRGNVSAFIDNNINDDDVENFANESKI